MFLRLIGQIKRAPSAESLPTREIGANEPSILLNTMPKSGSVYVARSLAKILKLDIRCIGNQYALIDQINVPLARTISAGGYVSQNHLSPTAENLQIIEHFNLKMVLHLRDPRQALLSWIYHLDYVTSQNDMSELLLYFVPRPPFGYFELSLHDKIDWQIENYLPHLVSWVAAWLDVVDRRSFQILTTQQEDLRTAEKSFFDQILSFYGFDTNYVLPDLPRTLEDTHFRRADPMEWRSAFSADQAAKATSMIPTTIMKRFRWDAISPQLHRDSNSKVACAPSALARSTESLKECRLRQVPGLP
jgi:hypothetical protein